MPQNACYREIFQPNTPVFASQNFIPVQNKVGGYVVANMQRPYLPYCGCVLDALANTMIPDTIANNQTFIRTFIEYFKSVRQASVNYYNDLVGTSQIDPASPYAGYLAKTTFTIGSAAYARYFQLAGIIQDFWANANPAWTVTEYSNALAGLVSRLVQDADKALYIPPAIYNFDTLDQFAVQFLAWKTANANLKGFLTVEFYQ